MKETGLNKRQLYLRKKTEFYTSFFEKCHSGAVQLKTKSVTTSLVYLFSVFSPRENLFFIGTVLAVVSYYAYIITT